MMIPGSLEYAQVRLQSRHAARANVPAWRTMEHARELPALIAAAGASGFDSVVRQLPMPPGLHALDLAIRNQWREQVDEVAGWMPAEWQPALRWCSLIVDLPFLDYLAGGGSPTQWMRRAQSDSRGQLSSGAGPEAVSSGWYREWRNRMPRLSEEKSAHLTVLVHTVGSHLDVFSRAAADEAWQCRRLLEEKLAILFRRFTLEPLAAFVFLALEWLALERLRGEIAIRIAFPSRMLAP
ncbi:MAG: hypothetical protein V4632_09970 [Pseudomonadota bacterium]